MIQNTINTTVESQIPRVARSRNLNSWIENDEPGSREIRPMRRALSDSLAIMFLGFAEASGTEKLERKLACVTSSIDSHNSATRGSTSAAASRAISRLVVSTR